MLLPSVVESTTHSSCISVMLQVADKKVFRNEGPLAGLEPLSFYCVNQIRSLDTTLLIYF